MFLFPSISQDQCFLNQGQGYGKSSLIKPAVSPSRALCCVHLLNYTLNYTLQLAESFLLALRFYFQVSDRSNLFHSLWKHRLCDCFPCCLRLHPFSVQGVFVVSWAEATTSFNSSTTTPLPAATLLTPTLGLLPKPGSTRAGI